MKLKSLLFGSAAAVIVASGAQAADAIVAEPEPMEYVKVCDTYGSGFFYIPGTETCLRISGEVRTQYDWNNARNRIRWGARARVNFDAREETDYGTLRGFIRLESNFAPRQGTNTDAFFGFNGNTAAQQAYIQLGGWLLGYTESRFVAPQFGGYTIGDGQYGYHRTQQIAYTYAANGFTGTLSLERDASQQAFAPNVVANLMYGGSWGYIFGAGALDFEAGGAVGYAVKAGAQFNLDALAPGDLLRIQGTYGSAGRPYLQTGQRWEAFASFLHVFNAQWSARLTGGAAGSFNNYAAAAQIRWNPVNNLSIRSEVQYLGALNRIVAITRIVRSF